MNRGQYYELLKINVVAAFSLLYTCVYNDWMCSDFKRSYSFISVIQQTNIKQLLWASQEWKKTHILFIFISSEPNIMEIRKQLTNEWLLQYQHIQLIFSMGLWSNNTFWSFIFQLESVYNACLLTFKLSWNFSLFFFSELGHNFAATHPPPPS